jgi:hypothetical protein
MDDIQTKLSVVKRLRAMGVAEDQIEAKLAELDAKEAQARQDSQVQVNAGMVKGTIITPGQGANMDQLREQYVANNRDYLELHPELLSPQEIAEFAAAKVFEQEAEADKEY